MINQLRKVYSSLIIYNEGKNKIEQNHKWFVTENHEVIGIHEDELTSKDISLLEAFLVPYNIELPVLTAEEEKWRQVIESKESNESETDLDSPFRFVYFFISENQISPNLFNDAIHELFVKKVPILWQNGSEGIIIEKQQDSDENLSYDQIIDVLMSDLYVNINFFVGPFRKDLKEINHHFDTLSQDAKIVFGYTNKPVVTYVDAIPYLLIHQTEPELRVEISKTILQEYLDDEDTLKMLETFVQCNLNISETAKELYMHRNSLQYRLDRFLEKTGIDVRQFQHAMSVYLAMLARK
ncbi:helix-turn-helix domain-containing protein [Sporosarcina sp. Marseille-Q4063]|uniref:PucR family transcriptional regulator n=1 Tax=Sporosarcina sp. Marseille-Q4063 TaxID=2810514 RepID=UPI001BAEEE8A|nr:helix-turn-helix domain-containing protein [Sporosarcina sp. Marseille-Q4063]QUW21589.1 helix-turn-helix domain-containing protein [Sporosarcina sp. Marseille-Q4063]